MSEHVSLGATIARRMRSWLARVGRLEDLFLDDPNGSIKRIAAIEVEIAAMKAGAASQAHRPGSAADVDT